MNRRILFLALVLFFTTQAVFIQPVDAAPQVTILSHSGYTDIVGFYHVVGEIHNTGDTPLEFVQITATFYDSSHIVVATSFTFSTLSVLLPGRKSPFEVLLIDSAQAAKVDHYALNAEYDVYLAEFPKGLEILSHSSYEDIVGFLHIVGEIKNTGASTATFVQVAAACYDESGTVVASAFTFSDPYDLAPDQVAPFEVLVLDEDQVDLVTSYSLTAESEQYAIVPEFQTLIFILSLLGSTAIIALLRKHTHV